jgi:hypothetical protein
MVESRYRQSAAKNQSIFIKGITENQKGHAPAPKPPRLGSRVRIPSPAPVATAPNFLRHFRDCEKAQLPQVFAPQAWGFDAGTLRRIALRMAFCLRSLGLGRFTLQAFLDAVQQLSFVSRSQGWHPFRLPPPPISANEPADLTPSPQGPGTWCWQSWNLHAVLYGGECRWKDLQDAFG